MPSSVYVPAFAGRYVHALGSNCACCEPAPGSTVSYECRAGRRVWILIHPVVMNEGKRLFEHLDGRTDLRLISVDRFERGAILVTYAPIDALLPPLTPGATANQLGCHRELGAIGVVRAAGDAGRYAAQRVEARS